MSSQWHRSQSYKAMYTSFSVVTSLVILLDGVSNSAHSAVLEETAGGTLAPIGGVSAVGPEPRATEDDDIGQWAATANVSSRERPAVERPLTRPSTTAVILDIGRERIRTIRVQKLATLPRPRSLVSTLSPQQRRMRDLTIQVGYRFARSPAVARAKLDRESFVALFTAMIQRESNFETKAVSPVGAKGLGQLMPGTARDLGVCDVFSPHDNLNGSATYLTAMLEQFGSPAVALAAYNAGPGAVARHGGIPPYRETRQYVADIVYAFERADRTELPAPDDAIAYKLGDASRPGFLTAYLDNPTNPQSEVSLCNRGLGVVSSRADG
ncbi:lytic transglycosylase domain-containing protein [Rhizobium sp. BT-226]|uniref:lytic transglycosylase domain-containing protein n=1 Tax=Rhizobium sp. BT-226 TaxID=2986922 RepID=UPI0021F69FE0|nr:lytic transglycosylase domain-containing protein [Rhizobium sp. BT-226]MCW0021353.1 lytic transglycosylase domain-containing protein [Rhizobium sp. BT-226]